MTFIECFLCTSLAMQTFCAIVCLALQKWGPLGRLPPFFPAPYIQRLLISFAHDKCLPFQSLLPHLLYLMLHSLFTFELLWSPSQWQTYHPQTMQNRNTLQIWPCPQLQLKLSAPACTWAFQIRRDCQGGGGHHYACQLWPNSCVNGIWIGSFGR